MEVFDHATIQLFADSLVLSGSSPNTRRAYRSDLLVLHRHLIANKDWRIDTAEGLKDFEVACATFLNDRTISASTTRRRMAAYRAFGNWAMWHFMDDDSANFLRKYRGPTVGTGIAHPLPGGTDDILAMWNVARKIEHKALVVFCGLLGLRVSEARAVRLVDFDDTNGDIVLKVRGKGDKARTVPVVPNVLRLLDTALVAARERDDGRVVPLADRTAREAWTRIGRRAGLDRDTATHDGRMTFGTTVFNKTKNLRTTQELLGHSSSQTTEGYTGITEEAKKEAVDIL